MSHFKASFFLQINFDILSPYHQRTLHPVGAQSHTYCLRKRVQRRRECVPRIINNKPWCHIRKIVLFILSEKYAPHKIPLVILFHAVGGWKEGGLGGKLEETPLCMDRTVRVFFRWLHSSQKSSEQNLTIVYSELRLNAINIKQREQQVAHNLWKIVRKQPRWFTRSQPNL